MKQYFYHVVTERPMHLNQIIEFNENHHSGVYERIYKEKRTDLQTPEEKVEGEKILMQTKPGVPEDEIAVEEPAE